ncbi:MAG: nickel-dependent hydrogenase large subunit [Sedimenticola sp.]
MAGYVEGSLIITLTERGESGRRVSIRSSRPLHTPRIFIGKGVDELIRTLPLIYSVCGTAQACAAAGACEQALGIEADRGSREAREMLVWFETAREHIWRILLDWSGFLGMPPDSTAVVSAMGLFKNFRNTLYPEGEPFRINRQTSAPDTQKLEQIISKLEQLLEHSIYQQPLDEWLVIDSKGGLSAWLQGCESVAARQLQQLSDSGWNGVGAAQSMALPELMEAVLERKLGGEEADAFVATPTQEGHCCETSPYTRVRAQPLVSRLSVEYGSGLLPRMAARLVELAAIPGRLRANLSRLDGAVSHLSAGSASDNIGIAQVEAARGRLIHRVKLADQRIADYRILAPTEWNFHPQGVVAQGLMHLDGNSHDELKRQATWLINTIDPCVGYSLDIS